MVEDRLGALVAEARDVRQQVLVRGVEVDANRRDARGDDRVELALQHALVHVVERLAEAERAELHAEQLAHRVLQAAAQGDRGAHADFDAGHRTAARGARREDRRSGFVDGDQHRQFVLRERLAQRFDELLGGCLALAVGQRDGCGLLGPDQRAEVGEHLLALFVGLAVQRLVLRDRAVLGDQREPDGLAAVAQREHLLVPERRRQQLRTQVARVGAHGLAVGLLLDAAAHVAAAAVAQAAVPRVVEHDVVELAQRRAFGQVGGVDRAQHVAVLVLGQAEFELEDLLTLGAAQREHAVRGDAADRLGEVEELLVALGAALARVHGLRAQHAAAQFVAALRARLGIVDDLLGEDQRDAFEHGLHGGQAVLLLDVGLSGFREALLAELAMLDRPRERQQALLFHLHRGRAAARTHRLVVVVDEVLVEALGEAGAQRLHVLAALLGLLEDRVLALLQLVEEMQAVGDGDQPFFEHAADLVATVACRERGRCAAFEQRDGAADVVLLAVEFGAETIEDGVGCHGAEPWGIPGWLS